MTNPEVTLGLFLHSHQPVGNFGWVFDENWNVAYRPMLQALHRHPRVRATLHYSGPLIDWLTENKPEFEPMLAELVDRGQVELAGGGYYEPILAMLPEADRRGQVRFMADEIERRWGKRPTGAWLTERVWEPGLPASLVDAGVEWTLTDDTHFSGTGKKEDELDGYYLTESDGRTVGIFPGLAALRASIPWKPVHEVVDWLHERVSAEPRIFAMGDDGEKFGSWPQTYHYCWEEDGGWVENFFSALETNSDWLKTSTLGDWFATQKPRGLAYLPTGSYHEMEEWTLPPRQQLDRLAHRQRLDEAGIPRVDLRPGFWRNFLVKYPEVASMRNRIFRVREIIDSAPAGPARSAAERQLWVGECNCPYWHGIFGGIYLHTIRVRTIANLVAAERLAHEAARTAMLIAHAADLDLDRSPEFLLRNATQQIVVDPNEGGAITEWDVIAADWPLLGVVARRHEAYHEAQGGTESISPGIEGSDVLTLQPRVFDSARRLALQERWLQPGATEDSWRSRTAEEDLPLIREWEGELLDGGVRLRAQASGLAIEKAVTLDVNQLHIVYTVSNPTGATVEGTLVSEWNLTLPDQWDGPGREALEPAAGGFTVDSGGKLQLSARLEGFTESWTMPVETISSSEKGLELSYQGICVGLVARLKLAPGDSVTARVTWRPAVTPA